MTRSEDKFHAYVLSKYMAPGVDPRGPPRGSNPRGGSRVQPRPPSLRVRPPGGPKFGLD